MGRSLQQSAPPVTHVVWNRNGTQPGAMKRFGKCYVTPRWVMSCKEEGMRLDEADFFPEDLHAEEIADSVNGNLHHVVEEAKHFASVM